MPELAEVEYHRKIWNPGLGCKIVRAQVNARARVFRGEPVEAFVPALQGAIYQDSVAHGKQMLLRFSRQIWLGVHLGMSGELLCLPADHLPQKHDHLVLFQKAQTLVFRDPRMFGRLRLHQGRQAPSWWSDLPPAPGSEDFQLTQVQSALARHPKLPLKTLLLDQEYFPGIGNWMADEILWQLQWSPTRPAHAIAAAEQRRLHRVLQKISRQALAIIGETWDDPPRSWLFQHRWRDGGQCPRCRQGLSRAELRGRTCCWCPQCQA